MPEYDFIQSESANEECPPALEINANKYVYIRKNFEHVSRENILNNVDLNSEENTEESSEENIQWVWTYLEKCMLYENFLSQTYMMTEDIVDNDQLTEARATTSSYELMLEILGELNQ